MQTNNNHVRHLRSPWARAFSAVALVAALVLFAAACGSGGSSASAGGRPTAVITTPTDGMHVGRTFTVRMQLSFPIGPPDTGRHHVHLHFDGKPEYTIAYAATHTVTLTPGRHTVVAV